MAKGESKEGEKTPENKVAEQITIDIFCDVSGVNSLDRSALKQKFSKEVRSLADWQELLKNDIVFKN